MQPIAVYEERLSERRHRFELFPDTIHVSGSTLHTKIDATIDLAQLRPSVMRVWVYSLWFYIGFWVVLAGISLLMVVVTVVEVQRSPDVPVKMMGLAGVIVSAGLVVAVWNRRKIEYTQFLSDAGVPLLGIARTGRGGGGFDQFVALLAEQIQVARDRAGATGDSARPPNRGGLPGEDAAPATSSGGER